MVESLRLNCIPWVQKLLPNFKRSKYKAYHDQKQGVKIPDIKPADFVKIGNTRHVDKVQSSKVTTCLEHTKADSELDLVFMDLNVESQLEVARPNIKEAGRAPPVPDPVRRSARERQPPPCFNDYVR